MFPTPSMPQPTVLIKNGLCISSAGISNWEEDYSVWACQFSGRMKARCREQDLTSDLQ